MYTLSSKVTRPVPPPQILDRPRLHARLDQWQATPVVFVHAPAGYGKSMLVCRWLEIRGLASYAAWLSLDPGDDDPVQFVRYLAAALEPIVPGIAAAVQPVLDAPEQKPARALEALLSMLQFDSHGSDNGSILLVLDDLHHIDSPALAPLMTLLLERCPSRLHFMLLGRRATYGPLTRLYAARQVLAVSETDLRFQPHEMDAYLVKRGFPSLTPKVLARLAARTEGWIVALQLITATAGNTHDISELLTATQSQHGWLAEYLTTQVLNSLPPAQRAFLFETSILDRFNTSLSAAVTGNGAKAAVDHLSAVIEGGLPMVQLDSRQEWFRYHHLFQELLQNQLRQEQSSASVATLHRRAAAWLARHDQVTAAVQHALKADDLSLAAAILEAAVRPEILSGGTQQAQNWLALFPDDALDKHPLLLLELCLLGLMRFEANLVNLVARTDAALASAQLVDKERRRTQTELYIYKIYAQFYRRNFESVRELIRDEDQRLADGDPLSQAWFLYIQMNLAWYEGQGQHALAKAKQSIEAFRDAGLDHAVISVRRNRAQISAHCGYPREALAMLQDIVATAQPNSSFEMNELLEAHTTAIYLYYCMDDIEGAKREQQSALVLAQRLAEPGLISEISSLGALFAMTRATGKSSEVEDSCPLDTIGSVLQINRLYLHMLVRQGQVERAWHFAAGFGVQIDGEISTESLGYFISLLEVTIARGIELGAITSRIAAAIAQAERLDSRLFASELYALLAWGHLQTGQREQAERALFQALDLAVETGYVRFILDIPALAPQLAVIDHPVAAGMWIATVSASQSETAAQLTVQERLVLAHLTQPTRYQDIADSLNITINTVRTHVRHIYAKLGVNKRKDAVARAHALGLSAENIAASRRC